MKLRRKLSICNVVIIIIIDNRHSFDVYYQRLLFSLPINILIWFIQEQKFKRSRPIVCEIISNSNRIDLPSLSGNSNRKV